MKHLGIPRIFYLFALMKCLFATFCTLLLSTASYAQVHFGVKAGGNLSRFASATPRIGLHAGIMAEMPIFKTKTLRTELLVSQKGVRNLSHTMHINGQVVSRDIDINLLYLELPIMLQFPLFNGLSIMPGMQVGARINRNIERTDGKGEAMYYWDRKFEYSFAGGLTYDFDAVPLSLDGRFTWSFIGAGVDQTAWQIGLGWWFARVDQ